MLIRGDKLPERLQRQILAAYLYRWTFERERQLGRCPACANVAQWPYVCGQALPDGPISYTQEQWHAYHSPLVSDAEWLKQHAFYVTKQGKLSPRHRHAEPASMLL